MSYIPSEPQTVGQVLDNSFKLYRGSFKQVVGLSMIYSVIVGLPAIAQAFLLGAGASPALLMPLGIVTIVAAFASLIFYGGLIHQVDAAARGESVTMGEAISVGMSSWGRLIGGAILFTLAVALGTIALIIPGIILMVSLSLFALLIVVDRENIVDSLKRSHNLVWGNWWRTVATFTVLMIVYLVPMILIGIVLGGAMIASSGFDADSVQSTSVMEQVLSTVAQGLLLPLVIAGSLQIMYDLKLRKEGGDLASRLAQA